MLADLSLLLNNQIIMKNLNNYPTHYSTLRMNSVKAVGAVDEERLSTISQSDTKC